MGCKVRSVFIRRVAGLGVVTVMLATAFTPAMAASQGPSDSPSFSTKSITKIVANATPDSRLRTDTTAPAAPKTPVQAAKSGSFFKTRAGMIAIALMAAGTGYALYSAKEDRIRGSIR